MWKHDAALDIIALSDLQRRITMTSALTPEEQKESEYGCNSLPLNIADWMIPETISVRKDSSCNVLVIVPYGYPGEDDNVELLGGLLAEELDCYAVINNRLYHRKPSKQLLVGLNRKLQEDVVQLLKAHFSQKK